MKIVKKTISLPKDLYEYAEERSKQGGEPANTSKYIRELIRRDKEEAGQKKVAA